MGNPYLKKNRLADVIAGITVLGTYKYYKRDFEGWADRICGSTAKAEHWKTVFKEHPEFFRISSEGDKASLVWRRQFPKTFHVDQNEDLPLPEGAKNHDENDRISRRPLEPSEITSLISVAAKLHDRALEQHKAGKWWIPILTAILALIGGLIGGWLSNADIEHHAPRTEVEKIGPAN